MEFTFYDVMESTYRVDFFIVTRNELTKMQTRLNQWCTAKTLVKYEITVYGDLLLFEVVRIKQGDE
jgi:hypothetical protein